MREAAHAVLKHRQIAYQQVFLHKGTATDAVLSDLQKFCRGAESTFHADPRVAAMLDGRREVWLRIAHYLHLTEEELWLLYANKSLPESEPKE